MLLCPAGLVAQEFTVPADYPAGYADIVEAAKGEEKLLVYSNVSTTNWAPFLALAGEKFPWMTIETTDDNALWEKYFAESDSGVRTADIILTTAPERWVDFAERGGQIEYISAESANLPDWSLKEGKGIYAASTDPFIMAYNRRLFDEMEPPRSVADVAAFLETHPDMGGYLSTYTPEGALGVALWKTRYAGRDNAVELLNAIGPKMRPDTSAGTMREKVTTGEYAVAIFTSGAGIRQYETPQIKALAGWVFPSDGTPVLQRSIAITGVASSTNSAKLFLDLLLSRDGQIAFAEGGQTRYRADIAPEDVPFASFTGIVRDIGEDNIILITPNPSLTEGREEFLAV